MAIIWRRAGEWMYVSLPADNILLFVLISVISSENLLEWRVCVLVQIIYDSRGDQQKNWKNSTIIILFLRRKILDKVRGGVRGGVGGV